MNKFLFFIIFIIGLTVQAQEKKDSLQSEKDTIMVSELLDLKAVVADVERTNKTIVKKQQYHSPIKAGLYSAVLPGLGQYYNKKYWKIPLVWGLIGTGIGVTLYQDKQYQRYRNAFILEINGQPNEFSSLGLTNLKEALGRQQDTFRRYRDYWIAITAIVYVLNIVDAVVDAHLSEGRRDPDLAFSPTVIYEPQYSQHAFPGLQLTFNIR